VAQLEAALATLGYTGFTVDDEFSDATENAVENWQEDIGATEDGIVDLGEIFFIPGPSIITGVTQVGTQVGASQAAVVVATEPLTPGADVAQLEAALVALGYGDGLTVDDTFTSETRDAVLSWQTDIGADNDGIVNLGEVYFSADALRISDQLASIGANIGNGSPVLAITAADIVVKVDLSADDQGLVATGDSVVVILPGNVEVAATIDSVATIATFDQQGNAIFEVVISLDDTSAAAGLDEAPVDVDVVSDSVSGVVAVPVSALVALSEGGYAVEVQQSDGTTVLVAVEPGFYADGLVEVTETQLAPGMLVVVP
jgi:peptidoglycan hydrolase-like protein with peptidoglycan-binding domain